MAYTTIDKPTDYFETILYTGNGSSLEVNGLDFSPDWVWIKKRSNASNSMVYDSVRGIKKHLHTNTDDVEVSEASDDIGLNSFDSDGFTVKVNGNTNTNNHTYASWNWKAETAFTNDASSTGVGNLDSAGSANDTAGFSIISYTGTGSIGTVAHGLGAVPKMILFKNRSRASTWLVYHEAIGNTHNLYLDATNEKGDRADTFNDTEPTSSVFTVGNEAECNTNDGNHIAYCFANKKGYLKVGSYTGNGNADGPFVYTGFRPAFLMYKNTTTADSYFLHDNRRQGYNDQNELLFADITQAESTVDRIRFCANGFKTLDSDKGVNKSGDTYVYMAIAEAPLVNSNGVPNNAR